MPMSNFDLKMPRGLTREEKVCEINSLEREAMRYRAKSSGLDDAATLIKESILNDTLSAMGITKGETFVMQFSEGDETVEFAEVKYGRLYVYHFSARGKRHKTTRCYRYECADILSKADK